MKVVYIVSPTRFYDSGSGLSAEAEGAVRRWAPRPGQFEFDLEELGALDSPTLVVVEEDEQTAYLHGYWMGGVRAVREMFGLFDIRTEQLESMTPQELRQLLVEERDLDPEALEIEGEGDEKRVIYPCVFRLEGEDAQLAEWEADGRAAERWLEEVLEQKDRQV